VNGRVGHDWKVNGGGGVEEQALIEGFGNGQERMIGAGGGTALGLWGGDRSNEGLGGGLGGGSGWEGGWGRRGGGRRG